MDCVLRNNGMTNNTLSSNNGMTNNTLSSKTQQI